MNRRETIATLVALSAFSLVRAANAQQATQQVRIAYFTFGSPESHGHLGEAFKQGMRALGYIEGKNVVFDMRWGMGQTVRLPGIAKELVALKPDVIVAPTGPSVRAALEATKTIQIVTATISDPVGMGLVKSLAHPGGNVTGLSTLAADHSPKLLELLLTVVTKGSRVAILVGFDSGRAQVKNLQTAAQAVGINVLAIEVQTQAGIEAAFARMAHENTRAIVVVPSTLFTFYRRQIAELAIKSRVPSVFTAREFPEAGGLLSYGSNLAEQNRSTATYVDRILKGAAPGDLPVEQASTFELVVNLKTAREIGITVPQSLLIRADRVIE